MSCVSLLLDYSEANTTLDIITCINSSMCISEIQGIFKTDNCDIIITPKTLTMIHYYYEISS